MAACGPMEPGDSSPENVARGVVTVAVTPQIDPATPLRVHAGRLFWVSGTASDGYSYAIASVDGNAVMAHPRLIASSDRSPIIDCVAAASGVYYTTAFEPSDGVFYGKVIWLDAADDYAYHELHVDAPESGATSVGVAADPADRSGRVYFVRRWVGVASPGGTISHSDAIWTVAPGESAREVPGTNTSDEINDLVVNGQGLAWRTRHAERVSADLFARVLPSSDVFRQDWDATPIHLAAANPVRAMVAGAHDVFVAEFVADGSFMTVTESVQQLNHAGTDVSEIGRVDGVPPDTAAAWALAAGATRVYWTDGRQVFAADAATGAHRVLVATTPAADDHRVTTLAVDETNVYWATSSAIYRTSIRAN